MTPVAESALCRHCSEPVFRHDGMWLHVRLGKLHVAEPIEDEIRGAGRLDAPAKAFAIVDPGGLVRCVHVDRYRAWVMFFAEYPSHAPHEEAIRAYEAIGYRNLECLLTPVDKGDEAK